MSIVGDKAPFFIDFRKNNQPVDFTKLFYKPEVLHSSIEALERINIIEIIRIYCYRYLVDEYYPFEQEKWELPFSEFENAFGNVDNDTKIWVIKKMGTIKDKKRKESKSSLSPRPYIDDSSLIPSAPWKKQIVLSEKIDSKKFKKSLREFCIEEIVENGLVGDEEDGYEYQGSVFSKENFLDVIFDCFNTTDYEKYCAYEYLVDNYDIGIISKQAIPVYETKRGKRTAGGKINPEEWEKESFYKKNGYTVAKGSNLSSRERKKILYRILIDNAIPKSAIIKFLETMINLRKNMEQYEEAVKKWEDDLAYIKNL